MGSQDPHISIYHMSASNAGCDYFFTKFSNIQALLLNMLHCLFFMISNISRKQIKKVTNSPLRCRIIYENVCFSSLLSEEKPFHCACICPNKIVLSSPIRWQHLSFLLFVRSWPKKSQQKALWVEEECRAWFPMRHLIRVSVIFSCKESLGLLTIL